MNKYRSHTCGELNISNKGQNISLCGWINKKRDHGNLLFIDSRDNYGVTQCVIDKENSIKKNELLSFLLDKNKSNISVLSSSESDELFSIRNKFLLRCPLSLNGLSNIQKKLIKK